MRNVIYCVIQRKHNGIQTAFQNKNKQSIINLKNLNNEQPLCDRRRDACIWHE